MLEEKHEIKIDFQSLSWDEIEKNFSEDHQIDIRRAYIRTYLSENPETIELLSQKDAFKSLRNDFLTPFETQYFSIVKPKKIDGYYDFKSGPYQRQNIFAICMNLGFEQLYVQLHRSYFWHQRDPGRYKNDKEEWDSVIANDLYRMHSWGGELALIEKTKHPLLFFKAMMKASNPYLYLTMLCATLYKSRIDLFDALIKDFEGQYSGLLRPHYLCDDGLMVQKFSNPKMKGRALSFENILQWNIRFEAEFDNWTFSDYAKKSNTTELLDLCVNRHRLADTPENPVHFIWACYVGDYETISRFIERYEIPSSEDLLTPLVACALSHQAEDPRIIRKLLEQPKIRAMMHTRNLSKQTSLLIAMELNKKELVRTILLASEDSELMHYTTNEIGHLDFFVKNNLKNTPVLNAILFVAKINCQNPNVESIPRAKFYDRLYSQDSQERFLDKNGVSLARQYLLEIESEKKRVSGLSEVDENLEKVAYSQQHNFAKNIILHHSKAQSGFLNFFRKPEVTSLTVDYATYKRMKDTKRKAKSRGDEEKDCTFKLNDRNTERSAVRDDQSKYSSENFGPRFRKVLDLSKDGKTLTCFFANQQQHQSFADKLKAYQAIGTQAIDDATLLGDEVIKLRHQSLSETINELCEICLKPEATLKNKTTTANILISYSQGIRSQLTPNPTLIVEFVLNILKDDQFDKNLCEKLISALSLRQLFSRNPYLIKETGYLNNLHSHRHSPLAAEAYCHIAKGTKSETLSENERKQCSQLASVSAEQSPLPPFLLTETYTKNAEEYKKSSSSNLPQKN